jgi:SulP family sulfate permease
MTTIGSSRPMLSASSADAESRGESQVTGSIDEATADEPSGHVISRWVPMVRWLPQYERSWLAPDMVAGFTLWGLLVPEMIAYAGLAGLSPQAGLYTLLATLGLYAIFGTSRHLVVAGTSATAVLVFSAVSGLATTSPSDPATLAAGMIVATGALLVVAGLLKLGFITQFLSRPVMAGFVFGLAIFVCVSQIPKLLGLEKGEGNTLRQLGHIIRNLDNASVTTLIVGLAALALLWGLEKRAPRVPGGLVVLGLGIGLSALLDLSTHGVAIIGDIPTGLPSFTVPDVRMDDLWVLLPSAIGMMLVIYSEALGAATTFAEKHGYRLDSNQEMIALGLANIGSGFLGGLAAGGSLSQSAVNEGAGARTELSPAFASLLSLVTVIALTPLFHDLPEAVLAALIIHAVSHLMRVAEMRGFYRLVPREFWLGMATLAGVVVFEVLAGLIIGVLLSLVLFIARASRPRVSVLGEDPAVPGAYLDVDRHPEARATAGVLVVKADAPIFYANAQAVRDSIDDLLGKANEPVRVVVLDLDTNDDIDVTTADQLVKLRHSLDARGVTLCLAHVHAPTLLIAQRAGLIHSPGSNHVFPTVGAALAWASDGRRSPGD